MEKKLWWQIVLEKMEKLIPQIKEYVGGKFDLADLGNMLESSILKEEEKQIIIVKLKEFSTKLSLDNSDENVAYYYLIGLTVLLKAS